METDVPRIRLFLLTLVAVLMATGAAHAATCKATDPTVRIKIDEAKVAYDHTLSIDALSAKMKKQKGAKRKDLAKFTHTLGITEPNFDFKGTYATKAKETADGACATVTSVDLKIDLAQVIYIASEAKKSSCIYKLVASHEKKHAELNRDFLRDVGKAIKKAIASADLAPATAKSPEIAAKHASTEMGKTISEAIKAYAAELGDKQAAVDTPKEYSRVNTVCGALNLEKMFARKK